jgi:hypothetical protein
MLVSPAVPRTVEEESREEFLGPRLGSEFGTCGFPVGVFPVFLLAGESEEVGYELVGAGEGSLCVLADTLVCLPLSFLLSKPSISS